VANSVLEVEGFEELNKQLKKLDDKVTRREVLKIQRQIAKPITEAYNRSMPVGTRTHAKNGKVYTPGNLRDSVAPETVPASKVGGNPSVVVRPSTKGKKDGYYRFMVVKKDTEVGSGKRGSRKGKNTVVEEARNKALAIKGASAQNQAEDKTAKYVQKQINKLSK
jgi:hypothetical protein